VTAGQLRAARGLNKERESGNPLRVVKIAAQSWKDCCSMLACCHRDGRTQTKDDVNTRQRKKTMFEQTDFPDRPAGRKKNVCELFFLLCRLLVFSFVVVSCSAVRVSVCPMLRNPRCLGLVNNVR